MCRKKRSIILSDNVIKHRITVLNLFSSAPLVRNNHTPLTLVFSHPDSWLDSYIMLRPLLYLCALVTLTGKQPSLSVKLNRYRWDVWRSTGVSRCCPWEDQVSIHQSDSSSCLSLFPPGAQQTSSSSSEYDISSCPINFYGQRYQHVYVSRLSCCRGTSTEQEKLSSPLWFQVNFTSQNLVVCFNGFYSPGTKADCILGPLPDSQSAEFEQYQRIPILETIVKSSVPTVKARMDCYFSFSYQHNGGYVSPAQPLRYILTSGPLHPLPVSVSPQTTLALIKFGPISVLYVYSPAQGAVVSPLEEAHNNSVIMTEFSLQKYL